MEPVIDGNPTPEQAAAIVAAIDALWPRPVTAEAGSTQGETSRWRFAGRWWTKPVPVRRSRPGQFGP